MISSLHLKNFQAHKDLLVKFTPGLNVIIGATDMGKSSVFRALDFALMNGAKKSTIVRHGAKTAEVTATVNGVEIVREKGKSKNTYTVDGKELKAFGSICPTEVSAIARLSDINFQSQIDPPFLISQTPGQIAKYLNEIANLDIIDKTLEEIESGRVEIAKELKFRQADLLAGKDDFAILREDMKACQEQWARLSKEIEELGDVAKDVAALESHVEEHDENLEDPDAVKATAGFRNLIPEIARNRMLGEEIALLEGSVGEWGKDIRIDFDEWEGIQTAQGEAKALERSIETLEELVVEFRNNRTDNEELDKCWKTLKKESPLCPLCHNEWKA